jgi:hypothetical protein
VAWPGQLKPSAAETVFATAMSHHDWVVFVFGAFNALRIVSYLPQIRCVANDRHGASAISYLTWSIWTGANVSTSLYAALLLDDPWLTLIHAVNAVCCVVVVLLTVRQRRRFRGARRAEASMA